MSRANLANWTIDPSKARKPDMLWLTEAILTDSLDRTEAMKALIRCVEWIEHIDNTVEDLHDKCAETKRLLGV